ncbi:MAG: MBL fold metallo-hydrolase [Candidatus Limnocylindrales bacterium]|jgi:glyoxylase-like metal-dependent hydrolase (beta-lactamase superfamily II)
MAITERVDWRAELGGGVRIALVQAGWFTSDAGTVFGPVPRVIWDRLVVDELNPDATLTQALNCLLVETPAGRVLVETGVGERLDERRVQQRGVSGPAILPALRDAGFDPATIDHVAVSHLHWDHAGGFLTSEGLPAFPRARIVAQKDEWAFALGDNPRLVASYEQDELRLVESAGLAGAADGREELLPGVEVVVTGGHTGGHQAIVVRGRDRTVGFFGDLCMRRWSGNPRWVPSFDDFPLTSVEVKSTIFRQALEEDWTVVLSHEPRTPIGRFAADRDRFRFEPTA